MMDARLQAEISAADVRYRAVVDEAHETLKQALKAAERAERDAFAAFKAAQKRAAAEQESEILAALHKRRDESFEVTKTNRQNYEAGAYQRARRRRAPGRQHERALHFARSAFRRDRDRFLRRRRRDVGGGRLMAYRYPTIKVAGRTKLRHRHVAEQKLGRVLRSDEHVHHRNKDPFDPAPDNLEVLDGDTHRALHADERLKYPRVKSCAVCGAAFTPHPTKRKRQLTCAPLCANIQRSRSEKATKGRIMRPGCNAIPPWFSQVLP